MVVDRWQCRGNKPDLQMVGQGMGEKVFAFHDINMSTTTDFKLPMRSH